MDEFLSIIAGFPTVLFTVGLGVCAGYWMLVIVGAVGSDLLDGVGGKIEGVVSAKVEGVAEAALAKVDGAADAALGGAGDTAGDVASGKIEAGAAAGAGALAALGFGKMPATVVISSMMLWAWSVTAFGEVWLRRSGFAGPLLHVGLALLGVFVGGLVTGLTARMFARVSPAHKPVHSRELVGRVATVTTGRVDERFGQATLNVDGADVTIDIRCDTPNALARHVKVVLVGYDVERHTYAVEAFDESVPALAGGKGGSPRA